MKSASAQWPCRSTTMLTGFAAYQASLPIQKYQRKAVRRIVIETVTLVLISGVRRKARVLHEVSFLGKMKERLPSLRSCSKAALGND